MEHKWNLRVKSKKRVITEKEDSDTTIATVVLTDQEAGTKVTIKDDISVLQGINPGSQVEITLFNPQKTIAESVKSKLPKMRGAKDVDQD